MEVQPAQEGRMVLWPLVDWPGDQTGCGESELKVLETGSRVPKWGCFRLTPSLPLFVPRNHGSCFLTCLSFSM